MLLVFDMFGVLMVCDGLSFGLLCLMFFDIVWGCFNWDMMCVFVLVE